MKVLLTTCSLVASGGVEHHLLDLGRELLRRGHTPRVYAAKVGPFAERFRDLSLPVVDDLSCLADPPDLIHGHYGLSLMAAVLRFPHTPAVQTCHGWNWRGDAPPNLPQVVRRLAVDGVCRERLLAGFGLAEHEVEVLFNGVDLQRFARRAAPAERPRRAAVFSNYMTHRTAEPIVSACRGVGAEVELLGRRFGADCPRPEEVLAGFDLVFAKGRCAWEAIATGCAVVVADNAGLGPLVTSAELPHQRRCNFGKRLMIDPLTRDAVAERIARYDPEDARRVSELVRQENSLEQMMDQLLSVYDEAVETPLRQLPESEVAARVAQYAERLCVDMAVDEPRAVSPTRLLRKQAVAGAERAARQAGRALCAPWRALSRRSA